jgi:hypothetical protein
MNFRVRGLSADAFSHLYGLSEYALAQQGVIRMIVDQCPGFPDRVEMREGQVGEAFLLVNHASQPAPTPYRATHAIFVREGAAEAYDAVNEIPDVLRCRLLSLRAFDDKGMMLDADVVPGADIEPLIAKFFANPDVKNIHVHNAKRGCYSGLIERA